MDEATRKLLNAESELDVNVGTPLREFIGTFDSYFTTDGKYGMSVNILWTDIDVVQTEAPVTEDAWTMILGFSKKARSKFGYLKTSIKNLVGTDEPLEAALGKRFRVKVTPDHPIWSKDAGKEIPYSLWEVIELVAENKTDGDPGMVALDLIVGKTDSEFISAATASPTIAKDPALRASIINMSWQRMMVEAGTLRKVDNHYVLVIS